MFKVSMLYLSFVKFKAFDIKVLQSTITKITLQLQKMAYLLTYFQKREYSYILGMNAALNNIKVIISKNT